MTVNITVEGLDEAIYRIRRDSGLIDEDLTRTLRVAQNIFMSVALHRVPVRTGFLMSTVYAAPVGLRGLEVGATAFYAGFVEWGTRRMFMRPFVRPGIDAILNILDNVQWRVTDLSE